MMRVVNYDCDVLGSVCERMGECGCGLMMIVKGIVK
jgi:hypothetical protein